MRANDARFAAIYNEAIAAGARAAAAAVPVPMVVSDSRLNKEYFVSDGVCGFGWVMMPGNTAFGKWARKNGHARPGYPKGLSIWSKLFTQSLTRNEAWARGVAEVLRANGVDARAESRID